MRHLLPLILLLLPIQVQASHVTCYSGGKMIYSRDADAVYYDDNTIVLRERGTHKDVFILGECVIKI